MFIQALITLGVLFGLIICLGLGLTLINDMLERGIKRQPRLRETPVYTLDFPKQNAAKILHIKIQDSTETTVFSKAA